MPDFLYFYGIGSYSISAMGTRFEVSGRLFFCIFDDNMLFKNAEIYFIQFLFLTMGSTL